MNRDAIKGGNPKPLLKWRRIKVGYANITTGKRPNYLILSGKEIDGWVNIVQPKNEPPELLFWCPRFNLLIEDFLNHLPPKWQEKITGLREQIAETNVGLTLCLNISSDPDGPIYGTLFDWIIEQYPKDQQEEIRRQLDSILLMTRIRFNIETTRG